MNKRVITPKTRIISSLPLLLLHFKTARMLYPNFGFVLTVMASFSCLTLANWESDKAAQINFYKDASCSQYNGEAAAWWTKHPLVGGIGSTQAAARAECFNLNMPGDSKSINTAAMWAYQSSSTWSGRCDFNDGLDCSGANWAGSVYPSGGTTCVAARSKDGYLWKSAKCYLN